MDTAAGQIVASWVLFLRVFERVRDMSKRYSQEFKDRAVRLLSDRLAADRSCSQWRAVNEIAPRLGIGRLWVGRGDPQ